MPYQVVYLPAAGRDFGRLPPHVLPRIRDAVLRLADDPRPPQSKKMEGSAGTWRLRVGVLEPQAKELMMVLEEMIYGPPPPNFLPTPSLGFSKGLQGSSSAVNGPGWVAYPANAFLYAARMGLPLVTDNPYASTWSGRSLVPCRRPSVIGQIDPPDPRSGPRGTGRHEPLVLFGGE